MESKVYNVSHDKCAASAAVIANQLPLNSVVFGIPRGGVPAAYLVAGCRPDLQLTSDPEHATVILDDLADSGATMDRYILQYPGRRYAVLFKKARATSVHPLMVGEHVGDGWIAFPWELGESKHDTSAEDSVTRMLQAIGEDPSREGLLETPKRVVKAWGEWYRGYGQRPEDFLKTFEDGAEGCDEMVLLTEIPVFSHCEHHLAPFIGVAHVAYIPNGRIVGLSKIPKIVDMFARRLQVQERLTNQIANCLEEHLKPLGVAVVIKAKHFCMATRGVKMPNVDTTTSAMRGVFLSKPEARAEFMGLIKS